MLATSRVRLINRVLIVAYYVAVSSQPWSRSMSAIGATRYRLRMSSWLCHLQIAIKIIRNKYTFMSSITKLHLILHDPTLQTNVTKFCPSLNQLLELIVQKLYVIEEIILTILMHYKKSFWMRNIFLLFIYTLKLRTSICLPIYHF